MGLHWSGYGSCEDKLEGGSEIVESDFGMRISDCEFVIVDLGRSSLLFVV